MSSPRPWVRLFAAPGWYARWGRLAVQLIVTLDEWTLGAYFLAGPNAAGISLLLGPVKLHADLRL